MDLEPQLVDLHKALGWNRPNSRLWAKLEILLGLAGAAVGLLLCDGAVRGLLTEMNWQQPAASLALIILGGYLALAGQRSHMYQSNNQRVAYLAEIIRNTRVQG